MTASFIGSFWRPDSGHVTPGVFGLTFVYVGVNGFLFGSGSAAVHTKL